MLVSTTQSIPGKEVERVLDVVVGNTVQSKHIGRDVMAGLKTIVGGEIKGYTEMMTEARERAQIRMEEKARQIGADAVICFRFSSNSVSEGMCELLAYGTAVKLAESSS